MNLDKLRLVIGSETVEWRKHVLQWMIERRIRQNDVLSVLTNGECIRSYADDRPFPSGLFLLFIDGRPLHVVAALDEIAQKVYVITVYEPSPDIFESDFKTRKNL